MSSEIIKELLVAIGFAADERSAKQAEARIERVEQSARRADRARTKTSGEMAMERARHALKEAGVRNATLAQIFAKTRELEKAEATIGKEREKRAEKDVKTNTRALSNFKTLAASAVATALAIEAATITISTMAQKVAERLEALAYSSDRTKSSVQDLKVFSAAVSQLGGTAGGALNDLESFAARLRQNPQGYTAFLKSVGVEARDAKGNIRGAAELFKEFRREVGKKPYEQQLLYADEMGISEQTWRATDPAKLAEQEAKARARYARMGHDPDKAAKDATELQNTFRDMWETIGVIGEKTLSKVFKDVGDNIKGFTTFLEQHGDQIADILSKVAQVILAVSKALVELATSEKVKGFLDWILGAFGKVDEGTGKWAADTEKIKTALEALATFVATVFVAKIVSGVAGAVKALAPLLAVLGPILGISGSALAALGIGSAVQASSAVGKGGLAAGVDPVTGLGPGDEVGGGLTPSGREGWAQKHLKRGWDTTKRFLGVGGASAAESGGAAAPQGDGTGTKGAAATGDMMRYAMDQLRREGVPEEHLRQSAAHLVGQATMESGLDPNKTHDGGTGYGIYGARDPNGWGDYKGARRSKMVKWLRENGYARNSAEGQMRYMAHEAMTGGYAATKRILMGQGSGDVTADTNKITGEFEAPAVINPRSGAVQRAMRLGPSEAPSTGGTLPGGAPAVLKPKSMPDAPGVVMDPKGAPTTAPGDGLAARAKEAVDNFRDTARSLNMDKLKPFGSATQGFDPGSFFTVPPAGTENTTNNAVRQQSFKGGDTHVTQYVQGGAAEGAEVFKRHKERQMADETRYAASVFA